MEPGDYTKDTASNRSIYSLAFAQSCCNKGVAGLLHFRRIKL